MWQIGRQQHGAFQQSAAQSVEGGAAGKLSYQFPAAAGSEDYVVFLAQPRVPIPGNPSNLNMQVYGDGSGNFLNAWVADSAGHVWQFTFGRINHSGWASMIAPLDLDAGWPNGVISGGEAAQLTPPLYLHALVVDGVKEGSENNGEIYLDALAVDGSAAASPAPPPSAPAAPTATTPAEEDSPPPDTSDDVAAGPVSGRIAYAVLNGSAMNTYVVEAATGAVWTFLPNMRQPDIAGNFLLVNGQGGGKDVIFRMSVDGSNQRTVSKHTEDSHPQWSPSTESIAYGSTHQGDGRWRLYWQVDATLQTDSPPLAFSGRELFGQYPVYLDNWRIAYQGCNSWAGGSSCGIYTADTGGSQPNQATTSPDDIPTGNLRSEILFMSKRNGSWDVYAVNWDGSGLRQLTNDGAFDGLATAGPGYQQIAFVSNRDGNWGMYVMNLDGNGQRKLFDLQGGFGDGDFSVVRERISWGP